MKTIKFPVELLTPQMGELSFNDFGASIEMPLVPFNLPDHGEVSTRISIDCIALPTQDIASLTGKSFRFPLNPEKGHAEGSVYIGYHHHPVDLLEMAIGQVLNGVVSVKIAAGIAFSFEGLSVDEDTEYCDTGWAFDADLLLPTAQRIH